ncbi:uncharacterized protein PB18E9.04c, partial [Drosophila navojoa]|uniref:uncharacterized protein PB18E9.04c n=1 Tax=Drosophila navojoa TaxID=7232 RepID=UPI0011BE2C03
QQPNFPPFSADVRQSPFSLELQPPLAEAAAGDAFNAGSERAIDSYGNPIDALRPIDTPDGRKVVSAQGLQFEIPNYASGITEIRKPADDLLPPHIDPIAVAVPSTDIDSTDSTSFAPAPDTSLTPPKHESSTTTTIDADADVAVEVEQAQLVPLSQQQPEESAQAPLQTDGTLPDYLLELQQQDKDIAGPVPWTPAPNAAPLSVIAWDLLPPLEAQRESEPHIITEQQPTKHVVGVEQPGSHNIRVSLSSGQGLSPVAPAPLKPGQVAVVPVPVHDGPEAHGTNAHVGTTTPRNGARFPNRHRGTVHYSTASATQRPRSTTSTTTTTTTTSTTTTTPPPPPTTTTTRRVTTTSTRSPPRSTTPLDPSTFYKLENEEAYAYTLPPWLQEVTDPDLDVAVTFIVPTDNDQYNHTVPEDLEPPFEPFVDLSNIQLTPPPVSSSTTSTTSRPSTTTRTTTTTTRRPSTTTTQAPAPIAARTTQAPIFRAQTTQWSHAKSQLITTTTTTSTAPPSVEPNPFDSSTLPPWLQGFDYPDVGPGVPYDPENFKDVPETKPGGIKPNDFQPHGFASRSQSSDAAATTTTTSVPTSTSTTTTTTATTIANTANTAFPSKVTLTLPARSSSSDGHELTRTVKPPLVLMPPVASSDDSSSTLSSPAATGHTQDPTTNSLTHFAERFDAPPVGQTTETKTAAEQQFPPFNAVSAGSAGDIPKVEYTKSDGGKVISTPIHVQRPEPAVVSTTSAPAANTGKYTGGFGAPAGLLRPLSGTKPDIYVAGNNHEYSTRVKANRVRPGAGAAATEAATAGNGGRYTGGFGAPSGVLSPQNVPRPFQQSQQSQQSSSQASQLAGAASSHHQSRFGGPPGILVPFDNVPRTGAK